MNKKLLKAIAKAMKKDPNSRFGQLIVNTVRKTKPFEHPCPEIFYITDEELIKRLEEF